MPIRAILLFLLSLLISSPTFAETIRLASWNVRYLSNGSRDDSEVDKIAAMIGRFDIVAVQEGRDTLVLDRILQRLPGWNYTASAKVGHTQKELYAFGKRLELRINRALEEMRFGETMLTGATNALTGSAFFKTIIDAAPINHDYANWLQDPGVPFVDTIHVDDWLFDPDAKTLPASRWRGHAFMLDYLDAIESEEYDADALGKIKNSYHEMVRNLRASEISKGDPYYGDEYTDYVRLIEVYLERENVIVTLPGVPTATATYLSEKEHDGPEGGPYDHIAFFTPPENALGVAPLGHLMDMHEVINSLVRKIRRDAMESKTVVLATASGNQKTIEAFRDADHGDILQVADPNIFREISIGDTNKATYDALAQVRELQNWIARNPEAVGGLKAEANTLGQDEMKLMQANIGLWDMQTKVLKVEQRMIEKIAWHIWNDKTTDDEMMQVLPSGNRVYLKWDARMREGEFGDYPIKVQPYIAQSDDPVQQYKRTLELITQVIMPILPIAAQEGVRIDLPGLAQSMAEKLDIHDMDRWFKFEMPMNTATVQMGQTGSNPMGQAGGGSPGGRVTGAPMNPAAGGGAGAGLPQAATVSPAISQRSGQPA